MPVLYPNRYFEPKERVSIPGRDLIFSFPLLFSRIPACRRTGGIYAVYNGSLSRSRIWDTATKTCFHLLQFVPAVKRHLYFSQALELSGFNYLSPAATELFHHQKVFILLMVPPWRHDCLLSSQESAHISQNKGLKTRINLFQMDFVRNRRASLSALNYPVMSV